MWVLTENGNAVNLEETGYLFLDRKDDGSAAVVAVGIPGTMKIVLAEGLKTREAYQLIELLARTASRRQPGFARVEQIVERVREASEGESQTSSPPADWIPDDEGTTDER